MRDSVTSGPDRNRRAGPVAPPWVILAVLICVLAGSTTAFPRTSWFQKKRGVVATATTTTRPPPTTIAPTATTQPPATTTVAPTTTKAPTTTTTTVRHRCRRRRPVRVKRCSRGSVPSTWTHWARKASRLSFRTALVVRSSCSVRARRTRFRHGRSRSGSGCRRRATCMSGATWRHRHSGRRRRSSPIRRPRSQVVAAAAKSANAKGFALDAEPYGSGSEDAWNNILVPEGVRADTRPDHRVRADSDLPVIERIVAWQLQRRDPAGEQQLPGETRRVRDKRIRRLHRRSARRGASVNLTDASFHWGPATAGVRTPGGPVCNEASRSPSSGSRHRTSRRRSCSGRTTTKATARSHPPRSSTHVDMATEYSTGPVFLYQHTLAGLVGDMAAMARRNQSRSQQLATGHIRSAPEEQRRAHNRPRGMPAGWRLRRAQYSHLHRCSDACRNSAVLTGFEPATSALTGRRALQTAPQDQIEPTGVHRASSCAPRGVRIPVTALKGRRPGPLDDGGSVHLRQGIVAAGVRDHPSHQLASCWGVRASATRQPFPAHCRSSSS